MVAAPALSLSSGYAARDGTWPIRHIPNESLGHDFTETWYIAEDMSHALLIAEFASSQDMVTPFNELDASGFTEQANGKEFEITSAVVIGDVDDDARAALSRCDFVNFLAPMPQG